MSSLPDIILPSFRSRTRSFLDEDRAARRALKMQDGIGMLDFAVEDPSEDPAEVFSVVQEALKIAVGVIANADDSLGMLSEVLKSSSSSMLRAHSEPSPRLWSWRIGSSLSMRTTRLIISSLTLLLIQRPSEKTDWLGCEPGRKARMLSAASIWKSALRF